MNTLNRDEWGDFLKHLEVAKRELDAACEILSKNWIYSPLGLQAEKATGDAHTECSNALYAAQQEQQRLVKEAQREMA